MSNELMVADYKADGVDVHLTKDAALQYLTGGRGDIPDIEIVKFIQLCKARGMNPFTGEVYLIPYETKYGVRANIITSKDTFTKRAYAEPNFDGFEAGITIAYKTTKDNKEIIVTENREGTIYSKCGERLVGGWARVYKKDLRIPIFNSVLFEEYTTGRSLWNTKPATMIRKVALVQSFREAFPDRFAGLYDSSEMGQEEPKIEIKDVETLQGTPEIPRGLQPALTLFKEVFGAYVESHKADGESGSRLKTEIEEIYGPIGEMSDEELGIATDYLRNKDGEYIVMDEEF
jgi:phage recombination protein Bet